MNNFNVVNTENLEHWNISDTMLGELFHRGSTRPQRRTLIYKENKVLPSESIQYALSSYQNASFFFSKLNDMLHAKHSGLKGQLAGSHIIFLWKPTEWCHRL